MCKESNQKSCKCAKQKGGGQHKCDLCKRSFKTQNALTQHKSKLHGLMKADAESMRLRKFRQMKRLKNPNATSVDATIEDIVDQVRSGENISDISMETGRVVVPSAPGSTDLMTESQQQNQMDWHLAQAFASYNEDHPLAVAEYDRHNRGIHIRRVVRAHDLSSPANQHMNPVLVFNLALNPSPQLQTEVNIHMVAK